MKTELINYDAVMKDFINSFIKETWSKEKDFMRGLSIEYDFEDFLKGKGWAK